MKKESVLNFVLIIALGVTAVVGTVSAATTISTDIATDGVLMVSGTASSSFLGPLSIGTSTPASILHVSGSNPTLTIGDTRNQTWTVGDQFGAIDFASDDTSSGGYTGKVRARIAALELDTFGASQGLGFYTTRIAGGVLSEQMRITDVGDVVISRGLATTSLGSYSGTGKAALVITGSGGSGNGNIQLTSSVSTGASGTDLGSLEWYNRASSGANARSAYVNVGLIGTSGADIGSYMAFGTDSDTVSGSGIERMRIDSQGNVGIGTTTPTTQLQVTASASNATTTLTIGKAGQTKGTCHEEYRSDGSVIYWWWTPAGAMATSSASCK